MKHTFHNILLNFLYLATLCTFFIIALFPLRLLYRLLKVVFAIRLARTLLNVNNHIKGAVMIETIFIGMATAFQLLRDDSTLFALAIILPTREKVNITTTPGNGRCIRFKIANEHKSCTSVVILSP
jgi:uncharacterized paraquat-inducible protein A